MDHKNPKHTKINRHQSKANTNLIKKKNNWTKLYTHTFKDNKNLLYYILSIETKYSQNRLNKNNIPKLPRACSVTLKHKDSSLMLISGSLESTPMHYKEIKAITNRNSFF